MSVWGCQIPWNWNYRQLWAATWVLGIEPRSFGRAATALNCWAVSPAPGFCFLNCSLSLVIQFLSLGLWLPHDLIYCWDFPLSFYLTHSIFHTKLYFILIFFTVSNWILVSYPAMSSLLHLLLLSWIIEEFIPGLFNFILVSLNSFKIFTAVLLCSLSGISSKLFYWRSFLFLWRRQYILGFIVS